MAVKKTVFYDLDTSTTIYTLLDELYRANYQDSVSFVVDGTVKKYMVKSAGPDAFADDSSSGTTVQTITACIGVHAVT